jgi:hypothetical protein
MADDLIMPDSVAPSPNFNLWYVNKYGGGHVM